MSEYFKKPNGEIFPFSPGRHKRSSCEAKYTLCDVNGKEIKKEVKKETKKSKK